ncbi:hypothetical protein [Streptomyces sp. E1N211]|uniref:hypothetical protein n=1 Tax=Streptomyces sp. E1N211 TaxID=1851876 RepID=UPI0018C2F869|nr:hypothetical protein [Streptomyces sp. E1N211]
MPALSVTVLLITAACVAYEREVPRALPQGVPEPPAATTPSPSATASPSAVTGRSTPVLNDEQARGRRTA